MRKPHRLSKRLGSKLPHRIAFLDTETTLIKQADGSELHILKLGYCCVCIRQNDNTLRIDHEKQFTSVVGFWEWLLPKVTEKQKLIVVCHNITYDATVMKAFIRLPELGFKLVSLYKEGTVGFFSFKLDQREILFVDNGNFFSGTLERWGKIVDVPKILIDFDHCSELELAEYCKNDVMIMIRLWEKWLQFLDSNDLGEFRVTTASTAFNAFRHRFYSGNIYIHAEDEVIDLERRSYHGGRVECLYTGTIDNSPFYYVDINSMYGYVMRENYYPVTLRGYSHLSSLTSVERKLQEYSVIAEVVISPTIPYFPYRPIPIQRTRLEQLLSSQYKQDVKIGDNIIYPLGTFTTVLTTEELRLALQNDWIQKINFISWYEREVLFAEYVDYFYSNRLQYKLSGNAPFAEICKLYVNSLYGKFGQIATTQIEIGDCDPHIVKVTDGRSGVTGHEHTFMWIGGKIIQTIREGEAYDSFPAIASHVTANARLYLYKLALLVGNKHVFYMDTDSLIVDSIGLSCLSQYLSETVLGSLKIEHQSNDLTIYAPKDYMMGSRIRTKGVNLSALWNNRDTITQTQWSGIKGMIRRGDVSNYKTYSVQKHLRRTVTSGIVGADGFVAPFNLDDISN